MGWFTKLESGDALLFVNKGAVGFGLRNFFLSRTKLGRRKIRVYGCLFAVQKSGGAGKCRGLREERKNAMRTARSTYLCGAKNLAAGLFQAEEGVGVGGGAGGEFVKGNAEELGGFFGGA